MIDIEKVIKALEFCTNQRIVDTCYGECPYAVADDEYKCLEMKLDALALLKEQEGKQTPKQIIHGYKEEYWGEEEICPDCGKRWQSANVNTTHFCPGCGRSVKWE